MKKFCLIVLLHFAVTLFINAQSNNKDSVYMQVDSEADFPGGQQAWLRYLAKNLVYPREAMNAGITGSVMLQFVVTEKGRVKKISALSGPEILQQEGIRLIRNSKRWIPAIKDGEKVSAYINQKISFKLEGY